MKEIGGSDRVRT